MHYWRRERTSDYENILQRIPIGTRTSGACVPAANWFRCKMVCPLAVGDGTESVGIGGGRLTLVRLACERGIMRMNLR